MPRFSQTSLQRLGTCDQRLQDLCQAILDTGFDITIVEGHRTEDRQERMVREGKSKLHWPNSRHNTNPSMAVDMAPYVAGVGIPWTDIPRFHTLAGLAFGIARGMGVNLRWGGDWDGDWEFNDQSFNDLPHFEIVGD